MLLKNKVNNTRNEFHESYINNSIRKEKMAFIRSTTMQVHKEKNPECEHGTQEKKMAKKIQQNLKSSNTNLQITLQGTAKRRISL